VSGRFLYIEWQSCVGCLIFTGHFPQKSPILSVSFAESDLHLEVFHASLPPYSLHPTHMFATVFATVNLRTRYACALQTRVCVSSRYVFRLSKRKDAWGASLNETVCAWDLSHFWGLSSRYVFRLSKRKDAWDLSHSSRYVFRDVSHFCGKDAWDALSLYVIFRKRAL